MFQNILDEIEFISTLSDEQRLDYYAKGMKKIFDKREFHIEKRGNIVTSIVYKKD